ncbi:hypothetical protein FH972_015098 [Carpinus fangiana]|uniref:Uncharacterized protein n=1 Tax=Carpinus fangiana TaxID=176857 RepID=A0A5N6RCB1_9ROSI|nr:hypothetical protein FH972_015098 [Carpinus fangiana]
MKWQAQAKIVHAKYDEGVTCAGFQERVTRQQEIAFNAKLELGQCREWLRRVRGEVDAGIGRIDAIIQELECFGPGQGSKISGWGSKPIRRTEPINRTLNNTWAGMGKGPGPDANKAKLKAKMRMDAGEGSSHGPEATISNLLKPGPEASVPVLLKQGEPRSSSQQEKPCDPGTNQETGDTVAADMVSEGELGESGSISDGQELMAEEGGLRYSTLIGFAPTKLQQRRCTLSASDRTSPEGRPAGSGLVTWPSSSWVAGKTGFGPVDSEMGSGMSKPVEDSKGGVGTPAVAAVSQSNI